MFKAWITVPGKDVRVEQPKTDSGTVKIVFRDASAVDRTIEQLEKLKAHLRGKK